MKRKTIASNRFITLVKLSTDSGQLSGYELFRTRDNWQHNVVLITHPIDQPSILKLFAELTEAHRLYGPVLPTFIKANLKTGRRIQQWTAATSKRDMKSSNCIKTKRKGVSKRKSP
jgi:hypothetical protein